eukprot:GEMP01000739.1.p1 GENE.GEMP01000739.1~~GEMP01000739.1.p1  ORF type:complete len:1399 (+),score=230.13 GEMP01000739.1:129-4325(+)
MTPGFRTSALFLLALSPLEVQASACLISKDNPFPRGNCAKSTYICELPKGVTTETDCESAETNCQCVYENFSEIGNAAITKRQEVCGRDRNATILPPGRRNERREELQRIVGADENNEVLPLLKDATSMSEVRDNIVGYYTGKKIWGHIVGSLVSAIFFVLWIVMCSWSSFPCCRKNRLRVKHRGQARVGTRFICCTFVFIFGMIMVYAAYFAWHGMSKINIVVKDVTCSAAQGADHIINGIPNGLSTGFRGGVSALNKVTNFFENENTAQSLQSSFSDSTRHDLLAGALENAKTVIDLIETLADTGTSSSEEFLFHGYAARQFLSTTEAGKTNGISASPTTIPTTSELKKKFDFVTNATRQLTSGIEAVYDRNLGNPSRRILDLAADEQYGAPGTYMTDILDVAARQMTDFSNKFFLAFVIITVCSIILFVLLQAVAILFVWEEVVSGATYRNQCAGQPGMRGFAAPGSATKFNYENPYNRRLKNLGSAAWCAAYLFGCLLLLVGGAMQGALVVPSGACEIFSDGFAGENKLAEFQFLSPVTRKLLGECIDTKGDGNILEIFTTDCPPGNFPFNTSKCDSDGLMTVMEAIDATTEYADSIVQSLSPDTPEQDTVLTKFEAPKLHVMSQVATIEALALVLIDPEHLTDIRGSFRFAMLELIPAAYVTGTACTDIPVDEDPEDAVWLATDVPKKLAEAAGVTENFRRIIGINTFKGYLESMTYEDFSPVAGETTLSIAKKISQKLQEDKSPRPKSATVCRDDFATTSSGSHRRLQEQDSFTNVQCPSLDIRKMTESEKKGLWQSIYRCYDTHKLLYENTTASFGHDIQVAQGLVDSSSNVDDIQAAVNRLMNRDSDPNVPTCDPCQAGVHFLQAKLAIRQKQDFSCNYFAGVDESTAAFQTRKLVGPDGGSKSYEYTPDKLPSVDVKTCDFQNWGRNMRNIPLHLQEVTKRFTGDAPFDWYSSTMKTQIDVLKASLASCSTLYDQSLQMNDALCFGAVYYAFILPSSYIVVGVCALVLGMLGFCMWRHTSDNYHAYERMYAKRRVAQAPVAQPAQRPSAKTHESANPTKDVTRLDHVSMVAQQQLSFEDLEMMLPKAPLLDDTADQKSKEDLSLPHVTFPRVSVTTVPSRKSRTARLRRKSKSSHPAEVDQAISDLSLWEKVEDIPTSIESPYSREYIPMSSASTLPKEAEPVADDMGGASAEIASSIDGPPNPLASPIMSISAKRRRRSTRKSTALSGDTRSLTSDPGSMLNRTILETEPRVAANIEGADNLAQAALPPSAKVRRKSTRKSRTFKKDSQVELVDSSSFRMALKTMSIGPASEDSKSQISLKAQAFEFSQTTPDDDDKSRALSDLGEIPIPSKRTMETVLTNEPASPRVPEESVSGPGFPHKFSAPSDK